jgi:hypothetical protein
MLLLISLVALASGFGEQTFLDPKKWPHSPCSPCKMPKPAPPPSRCVAKPDHRIDCGKASDRYDECRNKGCCYDPSVDGTRWCYQAEAGPKINRSMGIWIPNDDPAENNMWCLDCTVEEYYNACQEAGCPIPPTPPPAPPTPRPTPHPNCGGCEPGKIWINNVCLDCNAQQNYKACAAAGCG